MTEMTEELDVRVEGDVLRLTMNRPERLNALTADMADRLAEVLEAATAHHDLRAVLLTGAGNAFCSGADVSGSEAHENFDVTALDRANRIVRAIVTLDKPVVAGVNGSAAGVGCSMALACDLVLARWSAEFRLAFSRIGLMPDGGATATVAAAVGRARAMKMALLGEGLPAPAARDAGLISHVVADDDYENMLERLLRLVTAGPPLAFAATKKAINAATLPHLEDALERERTGQTILLRTEDVAEGMRAFGEKRRPEFRGR